MINSMLKQKKTWGDPIQQAKQMCFRMMSDAKYDDLLSSTRYINSKIINFEKKVSPFFLNS